MSLSCWLTLWNKIILQDLLIPRHPHHSPWSLKISIYTVMAYWMQTVWLNLHAWSMIRRMGAVCGTSWQGKCCSICNIGWIDSECRDGSCYYRNLHCYPICCSPPPTSVGANFVASEISGDSTQKLPGQFPKNAEIASATSETSTATPSAAPLLQHQ